jgi:carbon monoxide dehydrogenase subunit G
MKIESKIGKSAHTAETIYMFVSDFRNFNNFIPKDKVSNWVAEIDSCRFSMDMLGNVALNIVERSPDKLIKMSSDESISQYNFNLWIQLKEVDEGDTRIKVTIEPLLNQIMLSMVKKPLKKFVDSLVDEIEKYEFQS